MTELFFGGGAGWFTWPALIGTVFFVLRMGFMLAGGDAGGHGDLHVDLGHADLHVDVDAADVDGSDVHHGDSDTAFQILSLQTIAAFLMGLGWGGLGGLKGFGWGLPASTLVGLATGAGMVWLLARLLRLIYGFQSSGNVPLYEALQVEGSVYVAIPEAKTGRGRVRLIVNNRERFYSAVTEGAALEPHAPVRVVSVNDEDNTVTVTRA
jgi:hypothetical protein